MADVKGFLASLYDKVMLDLGYALVLGVLVAIVMKVIVSFVKWLHGIFKLGGEHSVTGFWTSEFEIQQDGKTIEIVDLYEIIQTRKSISLKLWHYDSATQKVSRFRGGGIRRGSALSIYYEIVGLSVLQIGSLTLIITHDENSNEVLSGRYIEYFSRNGKQQVVCGPENFLLKRASIPYGKKLLLAFRVRKSDLLSLSSRTFTKL